MNQCIYLIHTCVKLFTTKISFCRAQLTIKLHHNLTLFFITLISYTKYNHPNQTNQNIDFKSL